MLFYISNCPAKKAVCLQCITAATVFFTLAFKYNKDGAPVDIVYEQHLPRCPSCKVLFHTAEELGELYPIEERKRLVLDGISRLFGSSLRSGEESALAERFSKSSTTYKGALISVILESLKPRFSKPFTNPWFWR